MEARCLDRRPMALSSMRVRIFSSGGRAEALAEFGGQRREVAEDALGDGAEVARVADDGLDGGAQLVRDAGHELPERGHLALVDELRLGLAESTEEAIELLLAEVELAAHLGERLAAAMELELEVLVDAEQGLARTLDFLVALLERPVERRDALGSASVLLHLGGHLGHERLADTPMAREGAEGRMRERAGQDRTSGLWVEERDLVAATGRVEDAARFEDHGVGRLAGDHVPRQQYRRVEVPGIDLVRWDVADLGRGHLAPVGLAWRRDRDARQGLPRPGPQALEPPGRGVLHVLGGEQYAPPDLFVAKIEEAIFEAEGRGPRGRRIPPGAG